MAAQQNTNDSAIASGFSLPRSRSSSVCCLPSWKFRCLGRIEARRRLSTVLICSRKGKADDSTDR